MAGVHFDCPSCGQQYDPERTVRCPAHNGTAPPLDVVYEWDALREQFDPEGASREDIWRYRPLLPVDADPVTLGEGWTDLVTADSVGATFGVDLSLKLEGANPTGSTKDRGSSVLATYAAGDDRTGIACASTGNAAASAAAYAARCGLDCSIFIPEGTPDGKAVQPRIYGAAVETVAGTYSDAYEQCHSRTADEDWLDRSAGATPLPATGARTLGYELAEQSSPEWVAVSMGNGGTAAGIWEGWRAFARLGYTETTPRLLGVQATGATHIHDRLQGEDPAATAETCADSIAVGEPHRAADACRAIEESGGATVTVSDEAIREATLALGREEGVFAEPASAATVAGIDRAREQSVVDAGESVVAVITGNGLKDTATAVDALAD